MKSIFWDLETSDINPIGQILNFAFVLVDEDFEIIDQFTGTIKISRLQLPQPGAILANRIDVLEHQETSIYQTEKEAMQAIKDWIDARIEREREPVAMIGHNTSKFDLAFLRTSMIRNGVYPYFNKRCLYYADTRFLSYYVASKNEEFRRIVIDGNDRPFKLEKLCKKFGILGQDEKQDHESLSDVILTIKLSKYIIDRFGEEFDVRRANTYEPLDGSRERWGRVFTRVMPSFDNPGELEFKDYVLLDDQGNYALWIDVDSLQDFWPDDGLRYARESSQWVNKDAFSFVVEDIRDDEEIAKLLKTFQDATDIDLETYFPHKNCDLEQHIYTLGFNEMNALIHCIKYDTIDRLKEERSKNGALLYLRYKMNQCNNIGNSNLLKPFQEYCKYRYGGKLKLSKFNPDSKYDDGLYPEDFHITLKELYDEIKESHENGSDEDKKLMISLQKFYHQSDVNFFCYDALKNIVRPRVKL